MQAVGHSVEQSTYMINNFNISWRSTFFDQYEEAAAIMDLTGQILIVNPAFELLFGRSLTEIEGQFISLQSKNEKCEFYRTMQYILNGEKATFRRMVKANGDMFPAKITVTPVYDENEEIMAFMTVIKDLTEIMEYKMLIKMQNETQELEENLLLDITKHINEMIALYDLENHKFIYISPTIGKRLGVSVESYYGNPRLILEHFQIADSDKVLSFFDNGGTSPRSMELKVKENESDSYSWYILDITPIVEANGKVKRHISILKDITELKEKNDQIKQLDQLGVVGQLAAGIAHEIKNPLTAVKGFVQLLSEESSSSYSDIILSELERIESIMGEFLYLAKPQKEIIFKKENINHILHKVISFMNPEAVMNNVKFFFEFQKVPYVYCESKQIKQVIINLVKNGIESMPMGGKIKIRTFIGEDGFVIIEIQDEGKGISKEGLKRLREPFYTNKEKGTGLGLMVSYKIIEDHKGTIRFNSEEGEGTCVQILLPYEDAS